MINKIARSKIRDHYSSVFEDELIKEIEEVSSLMSVKANDLLIDMNEEVAFIPLLISGAVKILREDSNGEEIILYFLEKGDTCASSFGTSMYGTKSKIKAIAERDSEIISIPLEFLDKWLVKYKTWRTFILESYNVRLNEMIDTIDTLAFMKMDQRLLKHLRDRVNLLKDNTIITTHQNIAYDMNTSRVVVSRTLKELERSGLIKLYRNKIEVLK
ncbi:MAG: Crp/Fnr family transcriptional regulator [Flavobacteriaceae bacterium]|nr:Crp/Fnr family transcriptional regulator [Flavobacteriaceae bacterium]